MKLSILIPSTYDREQMTQSLVKYLEKQSEGRSVEIIINFDNRELSIGAKRQLMLEAAFGDYVTYIDSDDMVSEDYVSKILEALESNPDSVGFKTKCEGTQYSEGIVSNRFSKWDTIGGVYQRTPYQKSPIKRDIALQIGYKDKRYAEDVCYSDRLKKSGLIKSEVFIDDYLYFYKYTYQDPKLKYGIERKASNNKRKHG